MKLKQAAYPAFLGIVFALGAIVLASSTFRVYADRISYQWMILAYLTVLTGAFTIEISGFKSKFTVADTFIFINTILFGTAAGALTAALDGFLASVRFESTRSQRLLTTPFNTAVMAISAFCGGKVFFSLLGSGPLSQSPEVGILQLFLPIALSTGVYFLCNSTLVAIRVAFANGKNLISIWHHGYLKTALAFLASAAAGAALAFCIRAITPLTLLIVVPVLVSAYFLNKMYIAPQASEVAGSVNGPVAQRPAYRRFHYFMVVLGLGFIGLLLQDVFRNSLSYQWLVFASLAVLGGFITVKIPGIKIKFSLADTFVFANLILFGPMVGAITAAIDGFAGSLRCKSKARWLEFTLFNLAGTALSAYLAGEVFFQLLGQRPYYQTGTIDMATIFFPALILAVIYYLLNSAAVAVIVALQAQQNLVQTWRDNLMWGMVTCMACALGAVFVVASVTAGTPTTAGSILLMLGVIYFACKAYAERIPQKA